VIALFAVIVTELTPAAPELYPSSTPFTLFAPVNAYPSVLHRALVNWFPSNNSTIA
jgi:hypothetical protein